MEALFNLPASTTAADAASKKARARRSDPVTSHQAAQSVTQIGWTQESILELFNFWGPMHDAKMISRYRQVQADVPNQSDAGLRSRRAELVAKGLVQDSGQRVKLPSGRQSIVWEATK